MAQKNLLAHLPISSDHIFRMPTEVRPYARAAFNYQRTMATVFKGLTLRDDPYAAGEYPSFDLIMLGMGQDGHTASLFPGHPALQRTEWVAEVESDQATPPVPRLTVTLPLINSADTVLFLIKGAAKINLADSFFDRPAQARYPAALVRPRQRLLWYLVP